MDSLKVDSELLSFYDGYFPDDAFQNRKHELAAEDSLNAIVSLAGNRLGSVLDVGAGNGVLSKAMFNRAVAERISAAEISEDGLAQIRALNLPIDAVKFDGYNLPFADGTFDTAVCTHVVEHVEHERLFLKEVARVAKQALIVVPLEGGLRGRIDREMGHINYYTPLTFVNLIETGGFEVIASRVFSCSAAYERHISKPYRGVIKNMLRSANLSIFGKYAPHLMTCIMVVHCEPRSGGVL